jgi:hypothetical protein
MSWTRHRSRLVQLHDAPFPSRALRRFPVLVLVLCAALFSSTACAPVRLVAEYDERIDQESTRLQRAMDEFLTRAEHSPSGDATRTYSYNAPFYVSYAVDLRALKARATALQSNSVTVQQLGLMESNLERLRSLHQSQNTLSSGAIPTFRDLFNSGWTAILTFELAKKR